MDLDLRSIYHHGHFKCDVTFTFYSNDIKINLGYNDSMFTTLSTWNDVGASAGILVGLVPRSLPHNFC